MAKGERPTKGKEPSTPTPRKEKKWKGPTKRLKNGGMQLSGSKKKGWKERERKETRKGGDRHKNRQGWKATGRKDTRVNRKRSDRPPMIDRGFVAWDGEGQGDRLVLMANSRGDYLRSISGLGTEQVFDWLIKHSKPMDANVWFGFSWDVNMILRDLPWRDLMELYEKTVTFWHGYRIQWIPRRKFQVSNASGSFTSFDTLSFFGTSFVKALELYKVPVPDIILEGKAARSVFNTWNVDDIIRYNDEECRLLVSMMDKLRFSIKQADWNLRYWWGASALSGWFLEHHGVEHYIKEHKNIPAAHAYYGGRIETSGWGVVEKAWHYDIASAYPAAMTKIPDLTSIQWRESKTIEEFSLVRLGWALKEKDWDEWGPFPYRHYTGRIFYPPVGRGYYWGVEVLAAQRRLGKRLKLTVEKIMTPEGTFSYPLRQAVQSAYNHRMYLKRSKDPSEYPIKIGLNALYGKLAQKKGSANFRSYIWAGLITAQTRAMLSDLINGDTLSTMTDSVFSRSPLSIPLSDSLGAWNGGECARLIQIQAGVYDYDDTLFSRGFERDNVPPMLEVFERFRQNEYSIPTQVTRFITLGGALQGRMNLWCQWVTSERQLANMAYQDNSDMTKRSSFDYRGVVDPTQEWYPLYPVHVANPKELSSAYIGEDLEEDTIQEREDKEQEED